MIRTTPVNGFIGSASALSNFDLRPGLSKITTPTRFICGGKDAALGGTKALHAGVAGSSFVEIEGAGQLPSEVHITFYRLAQAALGNVVRHASSSQARVRLALADVAATLVISDDGDGFDPDALGERQGMGFEIMRERAAATGADLKIDSAIGHGTTVTLRWPA
jgi:signal transduction histidine kinase